MINVGKRFNVGERRREFHKCLLKCYCTKGNLILTFSRDGNISGLRGIWDGPLHTVDRFWKKCMVRGLNTSFIFKLQCQNVFQVIREGMAKFQIDKSVTISP